MQETGRPEILTGIEAVEALGRKLLKHRYILDGVSPEATENNKRVITAVNSATRSLVLAEPGIHDITIGGSRIIGLHTSRSDIDIVTIASEDEKAALLEKVSSELERLGVANRLDIMLEAWASCDVPLDPREFVYWVDNPVENNSALFARLRPHSPNLRLTQLAVLEVINSVPRCYVSPRYSHNNV